MKDRRDWSGPLDVSHEEEAVFRLALRTLDEARVPYSVGGAFALHYYAGVRRKVKDFDVHLLPEDVEGALSALRQVGFAVRVKHRQWLADALKGPTKVDLVYGLGNYLAFVDQDWIRRGQPCELLGHRVIMTPPEEIIWSKAFMCSRERYDAADIFHFVVALKGRLDWQHLLERFGEHWEVLLSQLVMFRYVYPSESDAIPHQVFNELLARLAQARRTPWRDGKVCRGPLLDGAGTYAQAVEEWGYRDARREHWERTLLELGPAAERILPDGR